MCKYTPTHPPHTHGSAILTHSAQTRRSTKAAFAVRSWATTRMCHGTIFFSQIYTRMYIYVYTCIYRYMCAYAMLTHFAKTRRSAKVASLARSWATTRMCNGAIFFKKNMCFCQKLSNYFHVSRRYYLMKYNFSNTYIFEIYLARCSHILPKHAEAL